MYSLISIGVPSLVNIVLKSINKISSRSIKLGDQYGFKRYSRTFSLKTFNFGIVFSPTGSIFHSRFDVYVKPSMTAAVAVSALDKI